MPRSLLLLIAALIVAIVTAGSARAHAALVAASPVDGAVLAAAPSQLTLSFSEPVSPLVLKLIGPDGATTPLDRFVLKDKTLLIAAPAGMAAGSHVLSWRVVSEDGHPVGGALAFSIGAASAILPAYDAGADTGLRAALWLGRVALYIGLFLGVGAAAFRLWVAPLPSASARLAGGLMATGLAAVPMSVGLQGLDALGAPFAALLRAELWRAELWRAGAATSFGATALIAALALGCGLLSLILRGQAGRLMAVLALLGTGLTLAASGHASAAAPQGLMRPAVFLHGIGIALWAGALPPLLVALGADDGEGALQRFSRRIPFVLAALLASGAVLAVVQIERPQRLLASAYGNVFLVKAGWLALLLALAALNRWRLTRAARAPGGVAWLRRSIAAEIVLVLLIFGTAALWRFTPPPRALALAASRPASLHIHAPAAMADVTVTPGRAGPVGVSISLLDGDFGPLPAKAVRIAFSNLAAGIEAIAREAVRGDEGEWRAGGLTLPAGGAWQVEIEVLVSDFEMVRLGGEIVLAR